jgi:hypothetical protein
MLARVRNAALLARLGLSLMATATLFAGTAAQAADRQQFDLVCTGVNSHIDYQPETTYVPVASPIRMRLSVDLKAKRWCYRDTGCAMSLPIASIDRGKIHLLSVKTPLNEVEFDLDRVTGRFARRTYTPQYGQPLVSKGRCVTASFTPLA